MVKKIHKWKIAAGTINAAVFLLLLSVGHVAAETPEYVVVGDRHEVRVLENGGDLEERGTIQSEARIRSIALDADRGWVWILDEDRYLSRHNLAGEEIESLRLSSPFRFRTDDGGDGELDLGGGFWGWLVRLFWHLFNPSNILYAETTVDLDSGDLLVASHRAVWRIAPNEGQTWRTKVDYNTRGLALDTDTNKLWVGTRYQAVALDLASGTENLTVDLGRRPLVNDLFFDVEAGHLRVHHHHDIVDFDRNGEEQNRQRIGPTHALTPADDGALWLARPGRRLLMVDREGQQLRSLRINPRAWPVRYLATRPDSDGLWIMARQDLGYLAPEANQADWLLRQHSPAYLLVASPRRFEGTLTLTAPEALALVDPQPTVQFQVDGNSRLLDEDSLELVADGEPVQADCELSVSEGEGRCTATQDLTEWRPALAVHVQDVSGNAFETNAVTVRLDSDGDEVPDEEDVYPDDPERSRLAPVAGLNAVIDGEGVHLQWEAHPDPDNTAGYILYRTPADGDDSDRIRLNESLLETPSWTDEDAEFGAGYYYEIVAESILETPSRAAEPLPVAVVFNNEAVENLTAQREGVDARLDWSSSDAVDAYRIYRRLDEDEAFEQWAEPEASTWLDEEAHWSTTWDYQVSTIKRFDDPFAQDDSILTLEGPRSETAVVEALPPLTMTLPDAAPNDAGTLEQLVLNDPGTVIVNYQNAAGPVSLQAVSADGHEFSQTASDGSLALSLPAEKTRRWHFTLVETLASDRQAEVELRVLADTTAPNVTIETQLDEPTLQESLEVRGSATDDLSGIDSVRLYSEHYPDTSFGTSVGENGEFAGEIPMEHGENHVEVRATDYAGNVGTASVLLERYSLPEIDISQPVDGHLSREETIEVSGMIQSEFEAQELQVRLGSDVQYPPTGSPGSGYPFGFDSVPLVEGQNEIRVRVDSPAGESDEVIWVEYDPKVPDPDDEPLPEIVVSSPSEDSFAQDDDLTIAGYVETGTGEATLSIDGEPVELSRRGDNYRFRHTASMQNCGNGERVFHLLARDAYERTTSREFRVRCDNASPDVFLVEPNLLAWPEANIFSESPVFLRGNVSDINLTGFTLNGTSVELQPEGSGTYSFNHPVSLSAGQERDIELHAWDLAGNATSMRYRLEMDDVADIEILSPVNGDRFVIADEPARFDVTARVQNLVDDGRVTVTLEDESPISMNLSGEIAHASVETTERGQDRQLTVSAHYPDGQVISSRTSRFTVQHIDDVPIEILRSEPAPEQRGHLPTRPISLYFNRRIDPSLLEIQVSETLHGLDYDLSNQKGAGFSEIPEPQMVQVSLQQQPVDGSTRIHTSNRIATYTPNRRFHYGSQVEVSARYDGERIARFRFGTRELPTIISGTVVDQFGRPVPDIKVRLPEIDAVQTTGPNGGYYFGAEHQPDVAWPEGQYEVEVNGALDNIRYGSVHDVVFARKSRLNSQAALIIPVLDESIPFRRISGGRELRAYDDHRLRVDFSDAELTFPDGRRSGAVHVQKREFGEYNYRTRSSITPLWIYDVEPKYINVSGTVSLTSEWNRQSEDVQFDMPQLVVIVAYDRDSETLQPAGVGRVEGTSLESVGSLQMNSFNAIGIAVVPEEGQEILQQWVDGDIASLDEVAARLDDLAIEE